MWISLTTTHQEKETNRTPGLVGLWRGTRFSRVLVCSYTTAEWTWYFLRRHSHFMSFVHMDRISFHSQWPEGSSLGTTWLRKAGRMKISTSVVLDQKILAYPLRVGGGTLPQVEKFKFLWVLFTSKDAALLCAALHQCNSKVKKVKVFDLLVDLPSITYSRPL